MHQWKTEIVENAQEGPERIRQTNCPNTGGGSNIYYKNNNRRKRIVVTRRAATPEGQRTSKRIGCLTAEPLLLKAPDGPPATA